MASSPLGPYAAPLMALEQALEGKDAAPRAVLLAVTSLRLGASEAALDEALAAVPRKRHDWELWHAALASSELRSVDRLLAHGASADLGLALLLQDVPAPPAVVERLLANRSSAVALPPAIQTQFQDRFKQFVPTTWAGLAGLNVSAEDGALLAQLTATASLFDTQAWAEWAMGLTLGHPTVVWRKMAPEGQEAMERILAPVPHEAWSRVLPLVPQDFQKTARDDAGWEPGLALEERQRQQRDRYQVLTAMAPQEALLRRTIDVINGGFPAWAPQAFAAQRWTNPAAIWPVVLGSSQWSWTLRRDAADATGSWARTRQLTALMAQLIEAGAPIGTEVPVRLASVLAFDEEAHQMPFEVSPLGMLTQRKAAGAPWPTLTLPELHGLLESAVAIALPGQNKTKRTWDTVLDAWASPAFSVWLAPEHRAPWQQAARGLQAQWRQICEAHPDLANDASNLYLSSYEGVLQAMVRQAQLDLTPVAPAAGMALRRRPRA